MHVNLDVGGPAQPLLTVRGLVKHFPLKKAMFGGATGAVRAVDGAPNPSGCRLSRRRNGATACAMRWWQQEG